MWSIWIQVYNKQTKNREAYEQSEVILLGMQYILQKNIIKGTDNKNKNNKGIKVLK